MKKLTTAAVLFALAAPTLAFADPLPRDANNESSCVASGMGMDPRCVGDVDPAAETAVAVGAEAVQPVAPAPTRSAQAPVVKKHRNL